MDNNNYLDGNKLLNEGKISIRTNANQCIIFTTGPVNCPNCSALLIGYGYENRKIIGRGDKSLKVTSQRLYCKNCRKIFHIYPRTLILPKIRYSPEYYNDVVNRDLINRECEACDSTQNRWRHNARKKSTTAEST